MALVKATERSLNDAAYNRLIFCHVERKRMACGAIRYSLLRYARATCVAAQVGCLVAPFGRIDSEKARRFTVAEG